MDISCNNTEEREKEGERTLSRGETSMARINLPRHTEEEGFINQVPICKAVISSLCAYLDHVYLYIL